MDKQTHARGWAMNAHMKKNKAGEAVMMDQAWKWGSHFTQDYQVSTCIEVTFTWSSEFKGVTGILTTDAKDPRQKPAWYIWKEEGSYCGWDQIIPLRKGSRQSRRCGNQISEAV